MRRSTGLSVDLELRFIDLFRLIAEQYERGNDFLLPAGVAGGVPEIRWLDGEEPGSRYLQFQRGPVLAIGQRGPNYLFALTQLTFTRHSFVPGLTRCRILGAQPPPYVRLYAEDAGPWWAFLEAAIPAWETAVDTAIHLSPTNTARREQLEAARVCVRHYQPIGEGPLHG